ncbi:9694_t:CDS:2 [Entrophospora sp. SA101]|nr:9694_t:CDS:2 [Entrophospora sp. SA101]
MSSSEWGKNFENIKASSLSDNCVFVAKQFFKFNNIKTNSNENNDVYCSR